VVIQPFGYPGHELPAFHLAQLELGPGERLEVDPDMVGKWRLVGAESALDKPYHRGSIAGGDGTLQVADDGAAALWLRLPNGTRKSGIGYFRDGRLLDYTNGDWVNDTVRFTHGRNRMILEEDGVPEQWRLVLTRDALTGFEDYVGLWYLQVDESKVVNQMHSGSFSGGSGWLAVGRDGSCRVHLQYPPDAAGAVKSEFTTGRITMNHGGRVFHYVAETWKDDVGAMNEAKNRITLKEPGNEAKWTLVFGR
ncbi:MAG: hypothetical protein AAF492_11590, partial [Verrucomicrobiota bacterium]